MNCVKHLIILSLYLRVSVSTDNKDEESISVRIKLGGKFHREILQAIEETLNAIPGVNSVNLTGMRSHAIIDAVSAEVTPAALIAALETIRGEDWQCTADLKSETAKLYRVKGTIDGENLGRVRHPQQGAMPHFNSSRPVGASVS